MGGSAKIDTKTGKKEGGGISRKKFVCKPAPCNWWLCDGVRGGTRNSQTSLHVINHLAIQGTVRVSDLGKGHMEIHGKTGNRCFSGL